MNAQATFCNFSVSMYIEANLKTTGESNSTL